MPTERCIVDSDALKNTDVLVVEVSRSHSRSQELLHLMIFLEKQHECGERPGMSNHLPYFHTQMRTNYSKTLDQAFERGHRNLVHQHRRRC